jgi:hypothetical protein
VWDLTVCPQRASAYARVSDQAPTGFAANELEAQEGEGFRFAETAPFTICRRMAAKLEQAGLLRMQRQCELLQPVAHRIPEASGVTLVLKTNDDIVGIPHDDHVACGFTPSPALGPEVELEHRIADPRIIRLIQKWLKGGILEDGAVTVSDTGTGQGSVISLCDDN